MRTPDELFAEGECDEMALCALGVLSEARNRLSAALRNRARDEALALQVIDAYANEIYDEFAED